MKQWLKDIKLNGMSSAGWGEYVPAWIVEPDKWKTISNAFGKKLLVDDWHNKVCNNNSAQRSLYCTLPKNHSGLHAGHILVLNPVEPVKVWS